MPRAIAAALVGGFLAVAGAIMQGILTSLIILVFISLLSCNILLTIVDKSIFFAPKEIEVPIPTSNNTIPTSISIYATFFLLIFFIYPP
ncbi:hypothetical protein [Romboutsia ilealis]|uniref:hypothetical protein n=1 Tax=Romboutsia ilealis TaxID=1115758 RepID=UPI002FE6E5BB